MKKRLVIIGNGMATGRLLQRLSERAANQFDITVFGEEPGGSYNRVLLSNLLSGELSMDKVITLSTQWYAEQGIKLHSQDPVETIDRSQKLIISEKGIRVNYDYLVIATGSYPTVLPIPGAELDGVMSFRTLKDVALMQDIATKKKHAVVIGGGFLGLEAAEGLRVQGMDVTLLHRGNFLLDNQLDETAGKMLLNSLEERGIKFRLAANTQELEGSDSVESVLLATGERLPADLVVTAIGVTPNKALAVDTELNCQRGILVNAQMQTSDQNIFSLGECCQFESFTYGLVAPIWQQADILVSSLLNEAGEYKEQAVATQLKISGIELFSCGSLIDTPDTETLVYHDVKHNEYRKLWLKDNRLVGAVLYGDTREGQWYFDQLKQNNDLSANRQQLLFGSPFCSQDTQTQEMGISSMATTNSSSNKKQLVVIGNGMVGHHFIENFVENEVAGEYEIHILAEESRAAYDRVHLSEYFGDSTYEDLCLVEDNFYNTHGVQLHLSEGATQIDRDAKQVITEQATYPYDTLVLATGSYPFVPPIPGNDGDACFVYRTLEDLDKIQACASNASTGVVVGGGLLGLEAANALKALGLKAHVVEFAPRLMPVQLDEDGGELLKKKIEALDVDVHCNKATTEIIPGESHTYRMNFSDGSFLETDLILFSAGIRPQDALARSSELEIGERGGILVNDQCLTSDPSIYAIGECALWNNQIFGLVAPGYTMAKTAVANISGDEAAFTGADMSTKLKLLGVDVGSIGDAHGKTPGSISYRYLDEDEQVYYRIVVSEDRTKLLGSVLVGDNSKYDTLLQYALNGIDLPEKPQALILPSMDGSAAPALGPDALPDEATICSCLNVTKGQICCSIDEGATSVADVKDVTKAASGCGGCAAMLKSVVDCELEKRGVEVCTDLCEHFAYTREELYHIIRVEGIRSYSELLEKHGKGLGCEICKPTAGSILASCWNEHIMDEPHVSLQDTNDTFMANMQKNGTYSIVPRIAGGEITPDKLIVLGQVAKKYSLYTKITGGQRVDLFGAQLHELPLIWKELVDAGFETGHAYGKSLRTVKSCVGSTWCRFGVNDSAGMAIKLENRYKGLRSPHKIKFAVSGCTRECAEAQSKDIGVIATENGWNLYVCGNGGMKPRHADLFATDLDDETLIKYIDRVLMFYVKTGDRLQRTSVWMDNMEGGLDYLKDVVIEDKLNIAEELESQMSHVVDTYQCEWKSTLEDEDKLKRFRSVVNSDQQADPQIVHIMERDQVRPA
tara:strand:+ start:14878 stop:18630 length:3753 start_codon:yes stop_codon:yes gene_type:complete